MPPHLPTPSKPLKILTIDGGGLQAISTLLILDKLLDTIAKTNGIPHRKPRPCDVFDTIAGIGAGGWLAILLGRFHLDISACLSEWYNITQCIAPRSKAEELRMRVFQHCYFDTDRLVEQIDHLTKVYGTGDFLVEDDADDARTRHVFVAALKSDAKGYNLFRTYDIPEGARLLDGPGDPRTFKITSAFGVTGAAKYFTPPWKEQMANGSKMRFRDAKFPKPHNITELALDEMWGLYGTNVPLSVVVNIGPGLPNDADVKQIARRFSWGLTSVTMHQPRYLRRSRSPSTEPEDESRIKKRHLSGSKGNLVDPKTKDVSVRFHEDTINREPVSSPVAADERRRSLARKTTFGSVIDRDFDDKLRRLESEIEANIKGKLRHFYPDDPLLYYRLAPEKSPQGTAQNDSSASGIAFDATLHFLDERVVGNMIEEVVQRMPSCPGAG